MDRTECVSVAILRRKWTVSSKVLVNGPYSRQPIREKYTADAPPSLLRMLAERCKFARSARYLAFSEERLAAAGLAAVPPVVVLLVPVGLEC